MRFDTLGAAARAALPALNGGVYYSTAVVRADGKTRLLAGAEVGGIQSHVEIVLDVGANDDGSRRVTVVAWGEPTSRPAGR